ncbi:hypothetical protein [Nocardiopsis sp. MG754419]|uniref:hypothetical protein n=1 Tax=Nocardiopsis sp. MG754419 TaxID=2259865 RepID=UPI001BA754B5|nr:hypothetical protein [Nocardiopsis sp. MG754419]MBR8740311.1 hypothetical protein [Nocardiopsis sp. MG754419]
MNEARETDPGAPPPQSRVFAVVLLVTVVVLALVVLGWSVRYLFHSGAERGDYEAAPDCPVGETDVLDELVPGHEAEIEEDIGSVDDTFGAGRQCRWATPEGGGAAVPAAATLVVVAAPVEGGEEIAADNLESTAAGHDPQPVDDLGEEALSWVEAGAFEVGCVGARVSNLYLESCYTAATDYDALESIDGEAAAADAERLIRAVLTDLPDSIEADETD